jgi:membrane-associated protease RseP (regulator of RpoE activity)
MSTTEERTDHHLPQPHPVAGEGVEPEGVDDPSAGGSILRAVLLVGAIVAIGLLWWQLLIVILAIVVSIFLHELGHYWTAKRSGMKVTEFFLFFGPRIWSFQRGETEYGIKCIPLGAYVKIIGMSNLEAVDPVDEPRTYRQKRYGPRMVVVLAGVTMNFLLALGLIYVFLVGFGRIDEQQWTVDDVSTAEDVERYDQSVPANAALTAAFARGESPAELAGLQPGDRVVAIEGEAVATFDELREVIAVHPGDEISLTIDRDGDVFERTTTLGTLADADTEVGFLGFRATAPTVTSGPLEAIPETFTMFRDMAWQSVVGFANIFTPDGVSNVVDNATDTDVTAEPADQPTPLPGTEADHPDEGRVLSIVGATSLGAQLVEEDIGSLFLFIALLNIFLGVVNLVPLLPFDGGHAAVATYEKVREKASGRQRYMADVSKLLPLTYFVLLVMFSLAALTLFPDIVNPPQL